MSRSSSIPAGRRLTRAGTAAFLEALAETGIVCDAAARAGVPRASLYRQRGADRKFAAAWAAALDAGLDRLRDEAVRRALSGVEETVWYRGEAVGTTRRPSDALLMFLLRAHQPTLYREPRDTGGAAERAADKVAKRAEATHARELAEAYERGGSDAIGELLARIDGKTRGIPSNRGERFDAESEPGGGAAADGTGDDDTGDDDTGDDDTGDGDTGDDGVADDGTDAAPVAGDRGNADGRPQARWRDPSWPPGYAPADWDEQAPGSDARNPP